MSTEPGAAGTRWTELNGAAGSRVPSQVREKVVHPQLPAATCELQPGGAVNLLLASQCLEGDLKHQVQPRHPRARRAHSELMTSFTDIFFCTKSASTLRNLKTKATFFFDFCFHLDTAVKQTGSGCLNLEQNLEADCKLDQSLGRCRPPYPLMKVFEESHSGKSAPTAHTWRLQAHSIF